MADFTPIKKEQPTRKKKNTTPSLKKTNPIYCIVCRRDYLKHVSGADFQNVFAEIKNVF